MDRKHDQRAKQVRSWFEHNEQRKCVYMFSCDDTAIIRYSFLICVKNLGDSVIMLTNSGYEYLAESTNRRNSAMLIKGSGHALSLNAEILKDILASFTSSPPPAVSNDWPI